MKKLKWGLFLIIITLGALSLVACQSQSTGKNSTSDSQTGGLSKRKLLPIYGTGDFKFGVRTQPKLQHFADYVKVLAKQIKRYNEMAPSLWPDNKVIDKSAIVEDLGSKKLWLIKASGSLSELSRADLKQYKVDYQNSPYGFGEFSGQGLSGLYMAGSTKSLLNQKGYDYYPHLGTYDLFITFAHEQFHGAEQDNWPQPNPIPNAEREEFMEDTGARAKRLLLIEQLMDAVSDPGNMDKIKAAVATYKDYQVKYPKDYASATLFDNLEGTAYYYELESSVYAAYPDEIKNQDDINRAMTVLLADHHLPYLANGLVSEGYNVGAFAGLILDQMGDQDWKTTVSTQIVNPMQLLEKKFEDQSLPAPAPDLSQANYKKIAKEIEDLRAEG